MEALRRDYEDRCKWGSQYILDSSSELDTNLRYFLHFVVAAQANNFTEMMDQEKAKLTAAREAWEEEKAKVLLSLFSVVYFFSYAQNLSAYSIPTNFFWVTIICDTF